MYRYEFITNWRVFAPVADVWQIIRQTEKWPEWWKGVLLVKELKPGDESGLGAIHRSTWRSVLPYTLEFDSEVISIEKHNFIEARAFGELDGLGLWQFESNGDSTHVRYDWKVSTTKQWMNLLAPVAKPIFRWNHDAIMGWGEKGLKRKLEMRN